MITQVWIGLARRPEVDMGFFLAGATALAALCTPDEGTGLARFRQPLYAADRAVEVDFPWQNGDLLFLDNIHTFHGRSPFVGHRDVQGALLA